MRLHPRICALVGALSFLLAAPVQAGTGLAISLENLYVPLGKQVERLDTTTGATSVGFGRESTEWIGLSGFYDLNSNWRILYGLHTTILDKPLFKFDGALAVMLPMPAQVPLQPYFFLGGSPVISTTSAVPPFGFNLHAGLGVDTLWNNKLYTQARLNMYMLSIYGEEQNRDLNLQWFPASFSLSAGMGYIF